jgi:protein-tyrosine-phosphatase
MYNVLMVCTANICRSPMGKVILEKKVRDESLESLISIDSCGVWAIEDQKACESTQEVSRENGLELTHHGSKSLTPFLVKNADLILTMAPTHKKEILNFFPSANSKVYTLKEYMQTNKLVKESIDDPIGMTLNFYRRVFKEIQNEINRIFPYILEKAVEKEKLSITGRSS